MRSFLFKVLEVVQVVLALGLEQRILASPVAGPSERPQGWQRPPPPTRRASPGAMPARTGRPQRKSSL